MACQMFISFVVMINLVTLQIQEILRIYKTGITLEVNIIKKRFISCQSKIFTNFNLYSSNILPVMLVTLS